MDKIICAGKNYLDHAKELGDAVPKKPVLFLKPPSSLTRASHVRLPKNHGSVHFECEIVFQIARSSSGWVFDGVTLGLDLTLRDLQKELKTQGLPWEAAKVFTDAAVVAPFCKMDVADELLKTPFEFYLNGELRQKALAKEMTTDPKALLQTADEFFPLCEGDFLFTGTPAGVGPLKSGDKGLLKWGEHVNWSVFF